MILPLTPNTQAILLLTAPLITGGRDTSADLLTLSEYNRLARVLREKKKQPADLIGSDAEVMVELCAVIFGRERIENLLGRGFLLSQATNRWSSCATWVVSRADPVYPRRLKTRLKEDAPPVLYGCGDPALLENGGLAIVGSRHVDDELMAYTEEIGRLVAQARRTVISGGAKGIDRAAMQGALQSGGVVAGVMADSLERAVLARDNREPLMEQKLVLISPYDPAAGFNVGHAMQRNKLIYALSDAALVVTSDFEKGGTWNGAIEQLEKLHFVPVFVRNGSKAGKGNSALLQHGALPWPNPSDKSELSDALAAAAEAIKAEPKQETLIFSPHEEVPLLEISKIQETAKGADQLLANAPIATSRPKADLLQTHREVLCRELAEPQSELEVAKFLGIPRSQVKVLLKQLIAEGILERLAKPVRYSVVKNGDRLL
jgi:predicted Rossmann fold nucleotide-binding protein DprA/Smf involved in DNA uptake